MQNPTCPSCGNQQSIPAGAPGYKCQRCQTDIRLLPCHKCGFVFYIYGPVVGSGVWQTRCPNCRARNALTTSDLRRASALGRQLQRAQREAERAAAKDEKEAKRLYVEGRQQEAKDINDELEEYVAELEGLLAATLAVDDYVDFESLKEVVSAPTFDPGSLGISVVMPNIEQFMPREPTGISKFVPGAKAKYEEERKKAQAAFDEAMAVWNANERTRLDQLAAAKKEHEEKVRAMQAGAEQQHLEIDDLGDRFEAGDGTAVAHYFRLVLENSLYPDSFPKDFRVAFVPESKQLVVDYELPLLEVVPEAREYKYVKSKDEIAASARPKTGRHALYASIIAQVALRTVHEVFEADRSEKLETVVFSGYVATTDKRTGKPVRPYLVTLRTTRDTFLGLDLAHVDPKECLKHLSASLSASPAELAPVRPVLEFNMVDPRFVEESDVLSTLDERPNLMELSPTQFESLITNLFEKMGLETRMTMASRDGGVDCVAYNPHPIIGGKVVIQAKRYKNTVGVSAVRDLFGTLQNEGASKGILVTTSGYGRAAFDFANGKPIELLDGGNLLYLLKEHAGIDAKIIVPEEWVDPEPDAVPADIGEPSSE